MFTVFDKTYFYGDLARNMRKFNFNCSSFLIVLAYVLSDVEPFGETKRKHAVDRWPYLQLEIVVVAPR